MTTVPFARENTRSASLAVLAAGGTWVIFQGQRNRRLAFLAAHVRKPNQGKIKELSFPQAKPQKELSLVGIPKPPRPVQDREYDEGEQARIYYQIEDYLKRSGGRATAKALTTIFKVREPFFERWFQVEVNERKQMQVSVRESTEKSEKEDEAKARQVARQLYRLGGAGDLHQITLRFGISKSKLLREQEGELFEVVGTELRLKGGAYNVAAAAKTAGLVTHRVGRRSDDPSAFITSQGHPVDEVRARRMLMRLEGLITSAGDGALPSQDVYRALHLKPKPALRRWFERAKLRMGGNGDLWVDERRLQHFRLHRAVAVSRLLANMGGKAPLEVVTERVYRPVELEALEKEELLDGELAWTADSPEAPAPGLRPGKWAVAAMAQLKGDLPALEAPEDETLELPFQESEEAWSAWWQGSEDWGSKADSLLGELPDDELSSDMPPSAWLQQGEHWEDKDDSSSSMVLASELGQSGKLPPPMWIQAWVAEYLYIEDGLVYFPYVKPWPGAERVRKELAEGPEDPERPPTPIWEEVAHVMRIEEEIRLSYGRIHTTALQRVVPGAKLQFMRRFFDVTTYGDVLPKSIGRQTLEAIGISCRIFTTDGKYTADDAWLDFGVLKSWLSIYFVINEDDTIGFRPENDPLIWEPPDEIKTINPFEYAKITAPRGYLINGAGRWNHKMYLVKKMGWLGTRFY